MNEDCPERIIAKVVPALRSRQLRPVGVMRSFAIVVVIGSNLAPTPTGSCGSVFFSASEASQGKCDAWRSPS